MMESEVMGNYHASFGERDGETRTVRIVKVRTVPTPLSPILSNVYLNELDKYIERLRHTFNQGEERKRNLEYRRLVNKVYRPTVSPAKNSLVYFISIACVDHPVWGSH